MSIWENLSGSQRGAVNHEDGPAAVYAGPGSGKTRVVTLRAARMANAGKSLLVTTFTNDATQEMRIRLEQMLTKESAARAHVSTLHALCLQILRVQGEKFQLLSDEKMRWNMADAAGAGELEGGISGFLKAQSYEKNAGKTVHKYKHDGSTDDIEFLRAWRNFEKQKTEKGLREFDDLILDVLGLLQKDASVREKFASRYSHIIVDECQDMNAPQYAVVFALAHSHKNLMLVGDLDQSLYGFRGADASMFTRFSSHPKTAIYELRENYRSTQSIISFSDGLIRQDEERWTLTFIPTRPEGDPVRWDRYVDPDSEAVHVGEEILRLKESGANYREIAVLYRTNAQSEAFERIFTGLEIPFTIREDGDFYGRKEIQGILAYLNFVAGSPVNQKPDESQPAEPVDNHADEWLLSLINIPNRKLSRQTVGYLRQFAEARGKKIWDALPDFHADDLKSHRALRYLVSELRQIEEQVKSIDHPGDAIKAIRKATDFDGWLRREHGGDDKDNDRIQNTQRMQAAAAHYTSIREYLIAIQKVRDEASRRKAENARKRRNRDEVTLSTGHAAKGLEWRCVFGVGWSEGILPHRKAENITEELRIAYVIATRARDLLYLSSLDSWNDTTVVPSRFLTTAQNIVSALPEELSLRPTLNQQILPEDELGGLFMQSL